MIETKDIMGSIWSSKDISETLIYLCDEIGPRPAGSEAAAQAANFIQQKFEEYGLTTSKHIFTHPTWKLQTTSFKVNGNTEPAIPFPFSKNAELSADTHLIMNPSEASFKRAKFDGKVLVVGSSSKGHGGMKRRDMMKKAVEGGAVAFVQMCSTPGGMIELGSVSHDISKIPAFSISFETAKRIERLHQRKKATISLQVTGKLEEKQSINIIGDIQGKSEQQIVSGAHYDTYYIGPGAFDNGTGVATLLGLAEAFSKVTSLDKTLRFIAFSAEELGLLGSKAYVKDYVDVNKTNIDLMMNYDCTSIKDGSRGVFMSNNMRLFQQVAQFIKNQGFEAKASPGGPKGTDADAFAELGIPTFGLAQFKAPSYMHTKYDTPDKISMSELKNSTAIAGAILTELLNTFF